MFPGLRAWGLTKGREFMRCYNWLQPNHKQPHILYLHNVHNPSRAMLQRAAKSPEQLMQTQEGQETVWKAWFKSSPHLPLTITSQKTCIWGPLSWSNIALELGGNGSSKHSTKALPRVGPAAKKRAHPGHRWKSWGARFLPGY